jgi:leucyl aminopeptidase
MVKKIIILFITQLLLGFKSTERVSPVEVSYDAQVAQAIDKYGKQDGVIPQKKWREGVIYYAKLEHSQIYNLSKLIKKRLHRHGGFIQHLHKRSLNKSWRPNILNYKIQRNNLVNRFINQLDEKNISNDIIHLSSYHTRYHTSSEGLKAMQWIYARWNDLTKHRSDIKLTYYKHQQSPQPTVILTIKGRSDKRIIIGGHADSINTNDEGPLSHAPGADDNAAGIAVITELINVLMHNNYVPEKTLVFMAYAAEEVGILGSYEIAHHYMNQKTSIDGVIQFDGVNYTGKTFEMALIDDYTSPQQNKFLAMLIDTYLKVSWRYDSCGYGCSDHAAWNYEGYHASYPVETIASEQNPFIHSSEDTFDKSNGNALHAIIFAKLGIAYILELDIIK